MPKYLLRFLFLLFMLAVSVACNGTLGNGTPTAVPSAIDTHIPREIPTQSPALTILAASSLTEVIPDIGASFRQKYPTATLNYSFASSSVLRTQLEQGAKADVFASADEIQMNAAVKAGVIDGTPTLFVKNKLVVIVPKNSTKVATLKDLSKPGLKLVLATSEVPVGNYARQSLTKMSQDPTYGTSFSDAALKNLVSNEANVRTVVSKVAIGEADAGFCYLSDVTVATASQVTIIPIPDRVNVIATYYIGVVKGSKYPDFAKGFIETITSEAGKQAFKKYNFNTD
ncbi:MAG: molybdate ABC transporter substrate-binding protein [Dehalococcoidia bacterium]|nr:molybdate ABC transporter substrate-binding protein [Dehalococcoidia bacterium]